MNIDGGNLITGIIVAVLSAAIIGIYVGNRKKISFYFKRRNKFIDRDLEQTLLSYRENFISNRIEIGSKQHPDGITHFIERDFEDKAKPIIFISAPTGIGKTTFLANLFLTYRNLPRRKRKSKIAYGLMYDLNSIAMYQSLINFGYAKKTILLVDALDELKKIQTVSPQEHWNAFVQEYDNFIDNYGTYFKKVILTVREQFLQTDQLEIKAMHKLGPNTIKLLPFDDDQQKKYITNRFSANAADMRFTASKMRDRGLENLLEIPLILNYLDVIFAEYCNRDKHDDFFSSYNILDIVVKSWLRREGEKVIPSRKLDKFCKDLAFKMATEIDWQLPKYLPVGQLLNVEESSNVVESFGGFYDRSLLIKQEIGGDFLFKFIHEKVFEFFLVRYLNDHPEFENKVPLEHYDFAVELLIGSKWPDYKSRMPKSENTVHDPEQNPISATKLEEWVNFFDGITANENVKRKLSDNGYLFEKLRFVDTEWKTNATELHKITINTNNFWDYKQGEPNPKVQTAIKYFLSFINKISFEGISIKDSHLSCFLGIQNIEKLEISNCVIGEGLSIFGTSVNVLTNLILEKSQITDAYLSAFAGANKLIKLDLNNNQLTGTCLYHFNKSIFSLKILSLNYNQIKDGCLWAFLGVANLKWLELSNNILTGEGLKNFIASATSLTHLWLSGNRITDSHLSAFAGVCNLEVLDLKDNLLTGEGLNNFNASTPSLTELRLSGNQITDSHLSAFTGASNLEVLDLDDNLLTGEGLYNFSASVPKLWGLWLSGNQITDTFLSAFAGVKNLESLNLGNNLLTGEGLNNFSASVHGLKKLHLFGNQITDTFLSAFADASNLEILNLGNNLLTGEGLRNFSASVFELIELALYGNEIADGYLSAFAGADTLMYLDLDDNQLTGEGLQNFSASVATLKEIRLCDNQITDGFLSAFAGIDNLIFLDLSNNKLTGEGLHNFSSSVSKLKQICLYGNQITVGFITTFENDSKLKYLELSDNKLEDYGIDRKINTMVTYTIRY